MWSAFEKTRITMIYGMRSCHNFHWIRIKLLAIARGGRRIRRKILMRSCWRLLRGYWARRSSTKSRILKFSSRPNLKPLLSILRKKLCKRLKRLRKRCLLRKKRSQSTKNSISSQLKIQPIFPLSTICFLRKNSQNLTNFSLTSSRNVPFCIYKKKKAYLWLHIPARVRLWWPSTA